MLFDFLSFIEIVKLKYFIGLRCAALVMIHILTDSSTELMLQKDGDYILANLYIGKHFEKAIWILADLHEILDVSNISKSGVN